MRNGHGHGGDGFQLPCIETLCLQFDPFSLTGMLQFITHEVKKKRKAGIYFVSKFSATFTSNSRIGRCCGQMASHLPHFTQSEAFPPLAVCRA